MGSKATKEVFECEICGKVFKRSTVYQMEYRRMTCSEMCRLIHWAKKREKELKNQVENAVE